MALYRQCLTVLRRSVISSAGLQGIEPRYIKRWVAPTLRELQHRRIKAGPPKLQPRSTFIDWNYDAEIFAFGRRLGEEFDEQILRRALTHRSYVVQEELGRKQDAAGETKTVPDNRELISRGDDIISRCVQVEFYKKYPEVLVNVVLEYLTTEGMLAHVAKHMGLRDIVLCADFPVEESTLADSFKAVVAALEASTDTERAERFVKDFLVSQLAGKDVYDLWDPKDPFEHLQGLLKDAQIEPRLCNESASNTILASFQVGLYSDRRLLGIGFGESIEIAKNTAALDAIQRIYRRSKSGV